MAVKKLYGTLGCLATMRALASIFEHELDFEFIPIDINAGDNKKEPFLSVSPFGDVPVFQDEDLTLFGSRAIMRFISHEYQKAGKEQVFEAPKLQGMAANWIDVEDHQFDPPATKLFNELVNKPKMGLTPDKSVVAVEGEKLAEVLDVYEERLKECNYLGGVKFTSADLTHLPNLYFLMDTPPLKHLFDERPRVNAWSSRILARPSWTKVVEMVGKM